MAANANRGQRSHAPSESDGLIQQTQEQIVNAQGRLIEAVMTLQEPMADALRKTFAMAGGAISTSQRIASPFDRLVEIQLDLVHKLFDVQVGLANMIFEAQGAMMELPRRAVKSAGVTSSPTASNPIDLRSSPNEHPATSTTQ